MAARSTRCACSPIACARRTRENWPHALVLLGDQVYADEVSPAVREYIRAQRDPEVPPGETVANFEEYTRLYRESWSEPHIRWLLSTVPTAMIFDDHDVHDDWNTSKTWVERHARQGLVGRAHRRRLLDLLALPAHGQPVAAAPGRGRALRAAARGRGRLADPERVRVPRRPRGAGHALELLPRLRPHAADHDRLARRPGARPAGGALDARPARVGVAGGARGGRVRPPADRHVAAVPARAGTALPGVLERGGLQRRLGRAGGGRRASGCARGSTSSTGRRSGPRWTASWS